MEETPQPDQPSAATVYPTSPFATHAPPPSSSSVAPSAASDAGNEAEESTHVESVQPQAVDSIEPEKAESPAVALPLVSQVSHLPALCYA